jgi:hypothetical protein
MRLAARVLWVGFALASCVVYDRSLVTSAGDGGVEAGPCGAGSKVMCGKTCVDLGTDARNCGSCGHDCVESACNNGSCAGKVLASALPAPRGIVLDANHVYFSNHGSITTQMMNKDGTGLATFGAPQIYPDVLVISKGTLYWNNETSLKGAIDSIDLSILPSILSNRLAVDLPAPTGVAVVANDVFFTTGPMNMAPGCLPTQYVNALLRCPTSGCSVVNCGFGGPSTLANGLKDPRGLIADAASLYWAETQSGNVFTCPVPSCAGGPKAIATAQGGPLDLAMDAQNLYWTNTTSGEVMTCPRSSCAGNVRTLATGQMSPRRIALENAAPPTVIWWTNGDGTVKRCALPDCTGGAFLVARGVNGPWGIAVDDNWAYVVAEGSQGTTSVDGAVIRFPR